MLSSSRWREADKRYELWTASITGDPNPQRLFANEHQVAPYFMPTDWSADGKKLAVLFLEANRPDSICLFSMADRSLHDLKTIEWGGGPISFSPDGNYLGFSREIGEESAKQVDVSILATDGSRLISVAGHPGRDAFVGWSPDGKTLLFVSNRTGSDALFGIGFADGKVQGAPVMIKADFGGAAVLGLTRAGGLYYTSRGDASSDIQIAPFDFEAGRWISAPITASGIGQQSNPEWSPDGVGAHEKARKSELGAARAVSRS